jgi:hypothetical protein
MISRNRASAFADTERGPHGSQLDRHFLVSVDCRSLLITSRERRRSRVFDFHTRIVHGSITETRIGANRT